MPNIGRGRGKPGKRKATGKEEQPAAAAAAAICHGSGVGGVSVRTIDDSATGFTVMSRAARFCERRDSAGSTCEEASKGSTVVAVSTPGAGETGAKQPTRHTSSGSRGPGSSRGSSGSGRGGGRGGGSGVGRLLARGARHSSARLCCGATGSLTHGFGRKVRPTKGEEKRRGVCEVGDVSMEAGL